MVDEAPRNSRSRRVVVAFCVVVAAFLAIAGVLSVRTTAEIDRTAASTVDAAHPSDLTADAGKSETTGSGGETSR